MVFDEQRLMYLLEVYADDRATNEEVSEMMALIRERNGDDLESVEWERIWAKIHGTAVVATPRVNRMKWLRVAAAAVVVLIATGSYYINQRAGSNKAAIAKSLPAKQVSDVQPGGNKAILTLANGEQIVLDNAANGVLAKQGNASVVKLGNGQLAYNSNSGKEDEVIYNSLGTPRGGQYSLTLPDGSKVWLNAVSSIRYPTAFSGKERVVEITGEAYFEVAKDKSKPFKVLVKNDQGQSNTNADDMQITVLGTHFNVNAYADEPNISTTLVEGSVKVSRDNHSVTIKPGEQSQLTGSGSIKVIHNANVDEAVAWRNGLFEFEDADLRSILRQVMRWYDVQVEYQGNIPERFFTAIISRDKTLTGVLEILKLSDIEYKLEGKKLVISQ